MPDSLNREQITATEKIIRPHIRRTPVIEADARDFGLDSIPAFNCRHTNRRIDQRRLT